MLADLRAGRYPRERWGHAEHLKACWMLQRALGDLDLVVVAVRDLISTYNRHTGGGGGPTGCHETITRYYVQAVNRLDTQRLDDLLDHPWCARDAPARHWSPDRLWSDEAHRRWVEPDLAPLPWAGGPDDEAPPAQARREPARREPARREHARREEENPT